ncbi:MAG: hypothetical protein NXH85_13080 [Pseudomonadaceae bacterium]|nr:hypothetical protein [Pseudomonadaceae bacterium]
MHKCRSWQAITWFSVVLALLAGCGGGSSSGSSSSLAGGQDPDPVVLDFPVAYIQRPLLVDDNGNLLTSSVRDAVSFRPGASLLLRDRASPSALDRVLTEGVFPDDADGNPPLYDVKDLSASFDGQKLVFAMRAPEDPDLDEDEQATWNIWLFDRELDELRRVIQSDISAEEGDDVAPAFLADGRIVFSSTRQRQAKAILLDEGKPQYAAQDEDRDDDALTLHVMNEDGTDVHQISFNASSDLDPSVTSDGRVVYSRWDNIAGVDQISLYSMLPDGRDQQLLYGAHSHDTGPNGETVEFMKPRELPDGRLLVTLRTNQDEALMSSLPVAIDTANYVDHDIPTAANAGLLADAQELLIAAELSLDESSAPLAGRYAGVYPLNDGTQRLLTSWSQCRLRDSTSDPLDPVISACIEPFLSDPNFVEADPLYGLWMYDVLEDTQQPVVPGVVGSVFVEPVVMEPRVNPPVILDAVPGIDVDADNAGDGVGVLHIRSVYDFDGTASVDIAALSDPMQTTAAERPARFLKIVKSVPMPDDDTLDFDNTAFGRSAAQLMREVIGYAPVEPDGSVKVRVPANVPLTVSVLDADGRRISPRHQNWFQVVPGEEKECVGCHTVDSELPHGRYAAQAASANPGAPVDGSPFPNTDPALFADQGESMAETVTRINGVPDPQLDLVFDDVWTDAALRAPDASFAYLYSDLSTTPPVDAGCLSNWQASCRITPHYPVHVQPIFEVDRRVFDIDGVTVLNDNTCISCHAPADEMGAAMVPAAQLDLTSAQSPDEADHVVGYRELLFNDNEQEVIDGALLDRLIQATDGNGDPLFEVDENGDLILDADGNPIPVLVAVGVQPPLSVAGANVSPRFFSIFAPGGSHDGRLTQAELKLISEWIDIGGQYYNNPFDVPP